MTTTGERFEQLWLPLWPLASDDLKAGIYRTSRARALGKRYVEANPEAISNLLVVDIDHDDALIRAAYDREGWRPNAVVENPVNGHAHAVWALREPVTRTEYAHRAPLAFAAAVTEGLRRSVDGDAAYSGLMTKNPEHTDWRATWFTDELYDLGGLAAALDTHGFMPPPSWKRTRRRAPVGLGRNCCLFESARTWAYREIRHHFGDPDGLAVSIRRTAHAMNGADFAEPLPAREVDQIAASIHRWIVTRSRMWADGPTVYEATFSTIQSARGRKGGLKSADARRQSIRHRIEEASHA
jgi:hypothetical protein